MARAVRAEYAEILCRATRAGMPQSVWTDSRLVDCIYRRQFARQKAVERNGHLMVVCYCRCPGSVVRVAGARRTAQSGVAAPGPKRNRSCAG